MEQTKLNPAVISSFSVLGKIKDDEALPSTCEHVEVYAFMHQAIPELMTEGKSVVEYLSDIYESKQGAKIESMLLQRFQGKKIVALATFIPELGADLDNDYYIKKSGNALKLLVDCARNLSKEHRHPIKTVELVAGSRIRGILKSRPPTEGYYIDRRYPRACFQN